MECQHVADHLDLQSIGRASGINRRSGRPITQERKIAVIEMGDVVAPPSVNAQDVDVEVLLFLIAEQERRARNSDAKRLSRLLTDDIQTAEHQETYQRQDAENNADDQQPVGSLFSGSGRG